MRRMYTRTQIERIAESKAGNPKVDNTTIKVNQDNEIYVNTDEIASVDYVDESVTDLITESEAQNLIDERTPEPEVSDLGKYLKVGSTGTMWSVLPNSFPVTFTNVEPTSDNNQGLIVVVLEDEPTQKYNGYIYLIEEGE